MTDPKIYTSKLAGKRVLIIGGTSGLGFAVAQAALESNSTVIISSSNPSRVEKAIERLLASYPSAKERLLGHACDLGSRDVEANIKSLFEKVGSVDHIVYTAGDPLNFVPLDEVTLEKMERAGMIRTYAALLTAKVGRNYITKSPYSSITMTTGSISEKPIAGSWSIASMVGSSIHGLTRQLAVELAPVRVNSVSPGLVETELWDPIGKEGLEGLKKGFVEKVPTGRVAQPDDIAETYLYLMKDLNVTGTIISTNGGALLV